MCIRDSYESDRVSTPFVCGLLRPRIYLPASLPAEDRHYVLLHERAHLRRRDHWTKPLAYLALCLHLSLIHISILRKSIKEGFHDFD